MKQMSESERQDLLNSVTYKRTIKQNKYDNWYGYVGGRRVMEFSNGLFGSAEAYATEWLNRKEHEADSLASMSSDRSGSVKETPAPRVVYLVRSGERYEPVILDYRIESEGPKTYKLATGHPLYGHSRIVKKADSDKLFFTHQAALEHYIQTKRTVLAILSEKTERTARYISIAVEALEKINQKEGPE